MSDSPRPPSDADLVDLIDAYLDGAPDAAQMAQLGARLHADPAAQDLFVRYARLHSDLLAEARAHRAADRALAAMPAPAMAPA
ncbi:MAG: hypothetical protein ACAI43_04845, partial [Phycisphaerae bacterium]